MPLAGQIQNFRPVQGGGGRRPSDVADRQAHANAVLAALDEIQPLGGAPGVYVSMTGRPDEPIAADKFDKSGLRLLNVRGLEARDDGVRELVFFAPPNAAAQLRRKTIQYRDQDTPNGRPKNADLVQSIGALSRASLRSLWRGRPSTFPQSAGPITWEVWVLSNVVDGFAAQAQAAGAHVAADRLDFPEQTVLQITASTELLAAIVWSSSAVAGLAKPATTAEFFDHLPVEEQPQWAQNLLDRTTFTPPGQAEVWVTLLDTGVTLGHPLLAGSIDGDDRHTALPEWALEDLHGHGSGMAGLAVYGDLTTVLHSTGPIHVPHRLESVKVLPDAGMSPHHLLGVVTRRGVDVVEAGDPRRRVFTLASSTPDDHPHDGAPTSWSAEIDQLAAGRTGERRKARLWLVAAGNVKSERHLAADYHSVCDDPDEEIESPAQAWNAITVGANTDKTTLGAGIAGAPLAPAGDLSPFSKTASWASIWPIKPDFVLEGGNLVLDALPPAMACQDLSLLTTHNEPAERLFSTFEATSAAAALGARLAAQVWADNPDRWPETIRALLVSSARWTNPMLAYLPANPSKSDYERLFRRYGYGVPDLDRASRSASNALSLIVEDSLKPYRHSEKPYSPAVYNQIKLHGLPWPVEGLRALGAQPVTLRVALSTFVEPNPAEAARGRKLNYASHGLRFKLNRAGENLEEFTRRINAAAQEDQEELVAPLREDDGWRFGSRRRDVGSLHIDELTCPASDLARRSMLAVHPVGGWWKSRLRQGDPLPEARYALVVEIDTGDAEIDLYAEVQATIEAQVLAIAAVIV